MENEIYKNTYKSKILNKEFKDLISLTLGCVPTESTSLGYVMLSHIIPSHLLRNHNPSINNKLVSKQDGGVQQPRRRRPARL